MELWTRRTLDPALKCRAAYQLRLALIVDTANSPVGRVADSPGPEGDSDTFGEATRTQDVSGAPDWSTATATTDGGVGATESVESTFPGSSFGSGSAATSTSAFTPASTSTSSFTSTSTSHMRVRSSPVISSLVKNAPSTLAQPSSSPPPGPSTVSATHGRSLPTPTLAGSISSAVLATVAAAILLRLWIRRRRARALRLTTPNSTSTSSASGHSTPAETIAVVRPRSKVHSQANDNVTEIHTRTYPVASESGSSHGACYGSATSLAPSPSSSESRPPPVVSADRKDCECHGPSVEHLPDHPGRPADDHAVPEQDAAAAADELEEAHPSERLLHFALPWALGQRMLAMMADEERVGGEGEEALPAYEPRG
ncbi:hypothetical protein TRAPUB_13241 [Trametes pubescens]|uniref:Uncharacterized protein n=1 Tax=Trametes pubescens TaxID=154538 RepID=A0A1M2VRQ9_TRAPU|nr:hypothetical protein TRAPUB_13241 [Trametes pubescens]